MFAKGMLCIWLITTMWSASAQKTHAPAQFTEQHHPLALIEHPDVAEDHDIRIRCASLASPRGYLYSSYCLDDGKTDRVFHEALRLTTEKARVTTPKVGRARKYVWIQYSVRFKKQGSETSIDVQPNWGLNTVRLGEHYSAPQEIPFRLIEWPRCKAHMAYWVSLAINTEGRVTDVDYLDHDMTPGCKRRFQSYIKKQRFIPAHLDGAPVPARHVDVYFSFRSTQAIGRARQFFLVDGNLLSDYLAKEQT